MDITKLQFTAKVVNNDPMINPANGWVEGFYLQDLDNGVIKHYIYNCPLQWEINPLTLRISKTEELSTYNNPITTQKDIDELNETLTKYCLDFIKKRNLIDIWKIHFKVNNNTDSLDLKTFDMNVHSDIQIEGLQLNKSSESVELAIIGKSEI